MRCGNVIETLKNINNMKIWKTIPVGIHATREEYRQMLVSNHFGFSVKAFDMMDDNFLKEKQSIELFNTTVGELGFKSDPTYEEICNKLTQLQYKKCIKDIGPALRLEYGEQQTNTDDEVLIIMEPRCPVGYAGVPFIFAMYSDGQKAYLSDHRAYPDDVIPIGKSIVFCR
jgi:hypothetical protein